ncbi:MAG: DinB family protein [Ferruginibacter sp.]|nr:DinB family protein [Ferruginibacter sp.]
MNKKEIAEQLYKNHFLFLNYIDSLTDKDFEETLNQKWSAGQQVDHIYRSVTPLVQALNIPHFVLKLLFGKANRTSKSYEDLVKKYLHKLETGGRASGRFVPKEILVEQKENSKNKLQKATEKLIAHVNKLSETALDNLIMPHPLLGKITLREMMYFTIYHVVHHEEITKRNLHSLQGK